MKNIPVFPNTKVKKSCPRLSEDEAVETVLRAQREISLGKGLKGDLRELMKKIK